MTKLDDTDREILSILRADARTPRPRWRTSCASRGVRCRTACARWRRAGSSWVTPCACGPDSEPHRIRAWMSIAVEGNAAPCSDPALRGEPPWWALHTTNGRWDIVAEVRAEKPGGFRQRVGPHPSHTGHRQYRNQHSAVHPQGLRRLVRWPPLVTIRSPCAHTPSMPAAPQPGHRFCVVNLSTLRSKGFSPERADAGGAPAAGQFAGLGGAVAVVRGA